jgi:hypothetical protein
VVLRDTVLNLSDFFLCGSDNGLIIVVIKQSVYLIKGLSGMVIFLDDLLARFTLVMLSLQFTIRLKLFVYLLCVYFQSFYKLWGIG